MKYLILVRKRTPLKKCSCFILLSHRLFATGCEGITVEVIHGHLSFKKNILIYWRKNLVWFIERNAPSILNKSRNRIRYMWRRISVVVFTMHLNNVVSFHITDKILTCYDKYFMNTCLVVTVFKKLYFWCKVLPKSFCLGN